MNQYNPRVQLKNWFIDGAIKPDDPTTISTFSKEFIVSEETVKAALDEMLYKNITKEARQRERKQKRQMEEQQSCDDIPWLQKVEDGSIKQLLVKSLDKYLLKHNMKGCLKLKKAEKIAVISRHVVLQGQGVGGSEPDIEEEMEVDEEMSDDDSNDEVHF